MATQTDGDLSPSDAAEELAKYCEIANHLSGLTADQYAASSSDERYIDSMLYTLLEQFEREPETKRLLEQNDQWRSLDRSRSHRLYEEFSAAHPEMFR